MTNKGEPAEAPNLAAEQGEADSAPYPRLPTGQPTTRQIRRAWNGKYDDLAPPEQREARA